MDMQSLLDLALRSTAAAADPCHEDLTCCVVSYYFFFACKKVKTLELIETSYFTFLVSGKTIFA